MRFLSFSSLSVLFIILLSLWLVSCQNDPFTAFELMPNDSTNEVDNSEESKAVTVDSSDMIGAWQLYRYLINGDNLVDEYQAMRLVLFINGDAIVAQENRYFEGKWRLTNENQSVSIFMGSDIKAAQIWYKEWLIMAIGKTDLSLLNITENRQLRMELSRIPEIPAF